MGDERWGAQLTMSETATLLAAIGDTDCESIHDGLLAQPVNAITSFSYVAAGLTLVVRGLRDRGDGGAAQLLYGSTLIAIGLGSVAFHGPQPVGSQFVHDVPIAAALLFIFLFNLDRLRKSRRAVRYFLIGLIPVSGAFLLAPTLSQAIAAAFAGAAVVTEVLVFRSAGDGRLRKLDVAAASLLVLAAVGYFFGRSGSAACDPDSLIQLHGLWHLLSAAAFLVWGFAAFEGDRESTAVGAGA